MEPMSTDEFGRSLVDSVEQMMRLMARYGVPELHVGDIHLMMPNAVAEPSEQPAKELPDGQIKVDPDLFAAVR